MGGMTGLGLAIAHPHRVSRLICCDARADAIPPFIDNWNARIASVEEAGNMEPIASFNKQRWFTPAFCDAHPDVVQKAMDMILATSTQGYIGCARALQTLDYKRHLGRIACPTLFLCGAQDTAAPAAVMQEMAALVPGAGLKLVDPGAHVCNMEAREFQRHRRRVARPMSAQAEARLCVGDRRPQRQSGYGRGDFGAPLSQRCCARPQALAGAARLLGLARHAGRGTRRRPSRIAELFQATGKAARLAVAEMGKTYAAALGESTQCAYTLRYYAEKGPALLADEKVDMPGAEAFLRFLPIGPVLAIMPWNFPFFQVVRFIAPALLGGNVGLLKHAENVPQCALALEEITHLAGLPEGVFQSLFIDIPTVSRVIADPRVAAVTVTGSERAGRSVAEHCGRALKKCVLELGGSDPLIVMPSADIEGAAKAAVKARILNNGQSCICAKRFIVDAAVYEPFVEAARTALEALVVGDPMELATDIGPLVSQQARDILRDQVGRALGAGGRLIASGGGADGPGFFHAPALIADIPPDASVRREELFGPVAMVFRVDGRQAALAVANEIHSGSAAAYGRAMRRRRPSSPAGSMQE